MRYFWYFLIVASLIVVLIIMFFAFSLGVKDKITFTDEAKLTAPTVTIADPGLGSPSAPVTLVNFGDYQCESCAELEQSIVALRAEYPEALRVVWKDMPNPSSHPEAINAAVAARCAGEQDMFWEYHSILMSNQALLGPDLYTEIATELELRDRPFARCLEAAETLPLVQRSFEEGLALDITATPTIYLNNERYTGAMTTSEIRRVIERIISDL